MLCRFKTRFRGKHIHIIIHAHQTRRGHHLQGRGIAQFLRHLAVIVHQEIFLNDGNQCVGIAGIARIASLLQSLGPNLVVRDGIVEEFDIAAPLGEEEGMVTIGGCHGCIFAEAIVIAVVVRLIVGFAIPFVAVASDAEMVVGLARDAVGAGLRRIDGLRQRDAGRHFVQFHLLHRQVLVGIDIIVYLIFKGVLGKTEGIAQHKC